MDRSERHALFATLMIPVIACAVLAEAPLWIALLLLVVCPAVLLHLVWVVLHDKGATAGELPPGHEWDYEDRPDLSRR
ncbi:MAG: hypothetical protein KDB84_12230 [Flavobacteriales bacterium]|nr:hypothetical protein [Flavobacteriales bacterium]